MRQKIHDYISSKHDLVVELQSAMTAIPAIGPDNGGDGESAKALYLLKFLKSHGFTDIQEVNAPDSRVSAGIRPNLVTRHPGKSPRTLWVIGHMDVVPEGDITLWESDPFKLKQDGDTLIGRGVEDNQQAMVSAILALLAVKECGAEPDLSLGVLLVSDEETHSAYGLQYVMENTPGLITPDDLVIIPDYGDEFGKCIEVAEKSCVWLKVTVTGKQCHASMPEKGVNTLLASSACVLELDELHRLFPVRDELYSPPQSTFVPSKKEANVGNINTVPGLDVFYVDCRVLPGIDLNEVVTKAQELVSRAAKPYGAGARVEAVFSEPAPPPTPADAPVVKRLQRSLQRVRNMDAKAVGVGAQTVAAGLRHSGIPTAAWSTIYSNPHAPNEKSSIINTIADARIFADMLFD